MGKKWKQWETLFWWVQDTVDGDCSHEIKRCLLLGRKAMINLDSILKRRDITLPPKVHLVKPMIFLGVMYGCESWTIKKAEHERIDAIELWCWKRLLRVPWTAKRSNHSILKEISPEHSLEELILKLKVPYFGHHLVDANDQLIGKDPDAGNDWGQEEKWGTEVEKFLWHHWSNAHEFEQTQGDSEGLESLEYYSTWGHKELDMTEWLNW